MKVQELFEATSADSLVPPTITKRGDKEFLVQTTAKKGDSLRVIYNVFSKMRDKKGVTIKTKSGKVVSTPSDALKLLDNRPNGLVFVFDNPEGAEEKLQAAIDDGLKRAQRERNSAARWAAGAPAYNKADAKAAAEKRKLDNAELAKKYGKGTWKRITVRQEGGDDGYQYVVRVDGKVRLSGLTRREAEYERQRAAAEIAKREGLGEFAEKKEVKESVDVFKYFQPHPAGKVKDVFKMDASDVDTDELPGITPFWLHAAATLLKAKNLNQLLVCDNVELSDEEFDEIKFKKEKDVDVSDLGYLHMATGTIEGKKAVYFFDRGLFGRGYAAYVVLK